MRAISHAGFAGSVLLLLTLPALAQTPDEHASHHPAPDANAASPASSATAGPGMAAISPVAPAAAGGMGSGMGEMMKQMGAPPPKELYPTLMALPDGMTPEGRDRVARLSHDRMQEGTASLSAGLERLSNATANNDYPAMQQATTQMHAGLADFESGIAGQRVIAEGQAPRNVALDWFRREMNLASPAAAIGSQGWFGVSFFHLFTMLLLVGFAVVMVAMYFFKMRRAAAMFGRLDPDEPPPASRSSTPPPGTPSPRGLSGAGDNGPTSNPASPSTLPFGSGPAEGTTPSLSSTNGAAVLHAEPPPIASLNASDNPVKANWRGRLRVGGIFIETSTVKTFRLVPASGDPLLPFTFLPGQFLNVTFWIGGAKMNRSYSISSSPNERAFVDLTIRREPRGAVSRHIDDLLKVGDLIETGGPVGKFTFTGLEADSIVLISGGVGITPMMSISRYLTERAWDGDIYFVCACRSPADYIFASQLPQLEQRNPKLHLAITMSRPEGTDWTGYRGRITKEWLAEVVPDLALRRTHLCGPPDMMAGIKTIFADLGIPADHLKTEAFGAVKPAPAAPGTARAVGPATGPMVTFSKNKKSARTHLDLQTGDSPPIQTILELSEELGIGIEFSCRVGTCGLCKVQMTSGEVDMEVQDALDPAEKTRGIILACQAKPQTDVTVAA